ncbi:MAG: prepilin-type N-terminal cleavage/methylation domain-containing protein [Candidatus Omnitrophota bacterium]
MLRQIRKKAGFSLLETAVATAVLTLVMVALAQMFLSVNLSRQKQERTLDVLRNAKLAMEYMANEIRTARFSLVMDTTQGGITDSLYFQITSAGRIWYWRGNAGLYGSADVIYRGVDSFPINANLVLSLREANLSATKSELANLVITPNPSTNNIFADNGNLITIELTFRPLPASPALGANRNYTLRTQVRTRN